MIHNATTQQMSFLCLHNITKTGSASRKDDFLEGDDGEINHCLLSRIRKEEMCSFCNF